MTKQPTVEIVTPVGPGRNPHWAQWCVSRQTYPVVHTVVYDDTGDHGGTPLTKAFLASRADFVLGYADDDWLSPLFVEKCVAAIVKHDLDFCISHIACYHPADGHYFDYARYAGTVTGVPCYENNMWMGLHRPALNQVANMMDMPQPGADGLVATLWVGHGARWGIVPEVLIAHFGQ